MVSIRTDKLGLTYPIGGKLTLARLDRRLAGVEPAGAGGKLMELGRKRYVRALKDVSFSLAAGDRLGLVGSNGAGKTTLLKVLYGIFDPTEGEVAIHGRVDALFNIQLGFRREATGRRNLELRGLINGWSGEEIAQRMDEIVEFSELGDFIDMPVKAYSQGMAARLAFAVATTMEPEILLMDEWIGAGDPRFQDKAKARMEAMAARAGIIVLASHNHGLLQRTCTKVLELEKGEVAYFGDAAAYFEARSTTPDTRPPASKPVRKLSRSS
ncbi:MAG: ABC transporter ATP-binding protein [Thermoanaerobaculia bacterium]